jgi:hypothetical protein
MFTRFFCECPSCYYGNGNSHSYYMDLLRGKPVVESHQYLVKGKCINCYFKTSIVIDKGQLAQARNHTCSNCGNKTMCPCDI